MNNSNYQINVATKADYKPLQLASVKNKEFRKQLKLTQVETKKLNALDKKLNTFENLKKSLVSTKNNISSVQSKMAQLGSDVAKNGGKMTVAQAKQARSHRKALRLLSVQYDTQNKKLKQLKSELVSSGINTNDFANSQRLLAAKTLSANKQLEEQKRRIEQVRRVEDYLDSRRQRIFNKEKDRLFKLKKLEVELAKARSNRNDQLTSVAAAGAYLMTGAHVIKQAANFETAMIDVDKKAKFRSKSGQELSDRESSNKLKDLKEWIVTTAPDMGLNAVELASIVSSGAGANVARAGRETEDLQEFAALAAKMSVAFDNLTAAGAGESVATWMASMKLDMGQSAELASAINHLSDSSAAQTGAVTELMTRSGSIMMNAGLSHTQSAAIATAILAANGNKADIGATAAKNMALTLTSGDAMSGTQKATIKSLGFDPVQLSKDMNTNAVQTIYQLIGSIGKQPEYKRNSIVQSIFGKESIESINPLISNVDELKRVMRASNNEVALRVSLDNEFAKQLKSSNFQIKRAQDSFNSFISVVGEQLLPVIESGAEVLADAMQAGTKFINEYEPLAGVVIKAAAAIAVLKAGTVAWRIASATMEIATLKRKVSEVQLSKATKSTAGQAMRAAVSIDRLNASLARTAAMSGADVGVDGKRRRKPSHNKKLGKLRKFGGKVPVVGAAVTAGLGAYALSDTLTSNSNNKHAETGELVGSIGGSIAGAAAGAALGSVIPIVGTAIGGIVGAIAGEELFSWLGKEVGEEFDEKPQQASIQTVKLSEIENKSFDGMQEKIIERSGSVNSNLQMHFSPVMTFHGPVNKAELDASLSEAQKYYEDYSRQSLAGQLDASMSDMLPEH